MPCGTHDRGHILGTTEKDGEEDRNHRVPDRHRLPSLRKEDRQHDPLRKGRQGGQGGRADQDGHHHLRPLEDRRCHPYQGPGQAESQGRGEEIMIDC